MRVWGVVVAAGSGERFGAQKQFMRLRGTRVVDYAVAAAAAVCDAVVVVLPEGQTWEGPAVNAAVPGGATRSASVRAGLAVVPDDCEVVVVHDAARPFASASLFKAVVAAVDDGCDGAVPGLPVADTLKTVEHERVTGTIPRYALVAVQTPQAFRAGVLRRAHAGSPDASDDAALVEEIGGVVRVVPGDPRNFKITTALDFELAAGLLEH